MALAKIAASICAATTDQARDRTSGKIRQTYHADCEMRAKTMASGTKKTIAVSQSPLRTPRTDRQQQADENPRQQVDRQPADAAKDRMHETMLIRDVDRTHDDGAAHHQVRRRGASKRGRSH
jgi:hypothetical protein